MKMTKKYMVSEIMREVEDVPATLLPHLLASKLVLEGARKDTPILECVADNFDLIGKDGTEIKIPTLSQLSDANVTAADMDTFEAAPSFSISDKVISSVDIAVTKLMYIAWKFSKRFLEDFPSIPWLRVFTRNGSIAMREKLASDIRTAVEAAGINNYPVVGAVGYEEVLGARAILENSGVISGSDHPWLLVSPDMKNQMLVDAAFTPSERYTTAEIERMVVGEAGLYGGCRVLVSPWLDDTGKGYIIPAHKRDGPVVLVAWKRRVEMESDYDATVEESFYKLTARYTISVVQPLHIVRIVSSLTP